MKSRLERIADYFGVDDKMSIKEIAEEWENGNKGYDSRLHGYWPAKELWPYREYTWTKDKNRGGWDELYESIKERGMKKDDPIILSVFKNGKKPKIGEGNHRLAIARELGIKKVPVMLFFAQG